jgi:hypothetical protein
VNLPMSDQELNVGDRAIFQIEAVHERCFGHKLPNM